MKLKRAFVMAMSVYEGFSLKLRRTITLHLLLEKLAQQKRLFVAEHRHATRLQPDNWNALPGCPDSFCLPDPKWI
jgi:hypothetical protein